MPITREQFIAVEGNINETWASYWEDKKDYTDLYNIIEKNSAQFTDFTYGAGSMMTSWNGSVQYQTIKPGYTLQYRPSKFDTGIKIELDFIEDQEYEKINNITRGVLYGVNKTLKRDTAAIFNNAFGSTTTGADGQGLCSASHKICDSSETSQSNTGTSVLSYSTIEATEILMNKFKDNVGDEMDIMPNLIIAGRLQRRNLQKLFGSDKEAFVMTNTKNVMKDDYKFYIHPGITGYKWFLCNEELMKNGSGLNLFLRKDPRNLQRNKSSEDASKGDFNTELVSWKCIGRWVYKWTNWYWCYGHNATS